MATLELKDVRKAYGALEVIHGVNVEIQNGEFVVLVGPSGCGKSTLLRMIAGLEEITDGTILIENRVVNDLEPKLRDIAMVFQNYALYPHLTVARNMSFSLRMRRERRDVIDAKVKNAAQILGLTPYLDRLPGQLSGGQRQRVAMGRAIVRDPQVFLFDEPLSNLDAKLRVQMRTEIKDLHERLRTTTIYVTHDQIEAMTMADKIVVLRDGVVEQIGSPLELYDRPANAFVGSFIGSPAMNLLTGTVQRRGGRWVFSAGEDVELPLPDGAAVAEDQTIRYGVRPEHFVVGQNGLRAEVMLVEPMGSETQVTMNAHGTPLVGVLRERIRVKRGDIINLSVDCDEVHLFEHDTEKRIPVPRDSRTLD